MSDDRSDEDLPEVEPAEPRRPRLTCPHCGSGDIIRGLPLHVQNQVGDFGIKYEATGRFLGMALTNVEPLQVDLCQRCGTVARLYVRETERKWCGG